VKRKKRDGWRSTQKFYWKAKNKRFIGRQELIVKKRKCKSHHVKGKKYEKPKGPKQCKEGRRGNKKGWKKKSRLLKWKKGHEGRGRRGEEERRNGSYTLGKTRGLSKTRSLGGRNSPPGDANCRGTNGKEEKGEVGPRGTVS